MPAVTHTRSLPFAVLLHEVDRVYLDVDGGGVEAGRERCLAERQLDELAEARAAARLEEDLHAVLAAQSRERRRRGAEHSRGAFGVRGVERAAQLDRSRLHARQVFAVYEQRCERDERRVAEVSAVANLLLEEAFVILRARVAERV